MSETQTEIQPGDGLPEEDDVIRVDAPDGTVSAADLPSPVEEATQAPIDSIEDPAASSEEASASDDSSVGEVGDGHAEPTRFERELEPNKFSEMTYSARSPLDPKNRTPLDDYLNVLNSDVNELNAYAEHYPQLDVLTTPEGLAWMERIEEGQRLLLRGNALLGSMVRDTAMWRQSVTSGAEQLQAGRPKFGEGGDGGKLVGEAAMMKLQALTGVGAVVRIPLWHTGIWISLKAPTEAALLELDRRIGQEKILLGRQSNGLIFSNSSIYLTSYLVNFVLAHVYEATVKFTKTEELKDVIKVSDIPTMIWGLLCTIYPNGYPFRQPCVVDPTACNHVVEEMLNISKLSWTDDRALTEWQRKLMVRKLSKFTPQELQRYEEEHQFNKHATVQLSQHLAMELKVPTIADYERSGFSWVDSCVQHVDQAFGGTLKGQERNDFIVERGQITAMRQYAHWISRLVLQGKEIIDDPATIEETIATLTGNEEMYTNFFNGVGKFIDNTTVSLIAIPKYDCPACGKPQSEELVKHPHLIPLDVGQVFFILNDRRVTRVLQRARL